MIKKSNENIAVIGSGLSAIGAIRSLIDSGHKPTVIDFGEELSTEKKALISDLSKKPTKDWTNTELSNLIKSPNDSSKSPLSIPKKFLYGSDYFYGRSKKNLPIYKNKDIPPLSYAFGGLSSGWGAAALPISEGDLENWPISWEEIDEAFDRILSNLPYSAVEDRLSDKFKIYQDNPQALKISNGASMLLESLNKSYQKENKDILFGQARLLIDSDKCKYYGHSMSGCVYGSIYQASEEINNLIKDNKITYLNNCIVDSLEEDENKVYVNFYKLENGENGTLLKKEFDRVFLAAGATNSTRIVLNSKKLYDEDVNLRARGSYVLPFFSFRKLHSNWPNCNTHPELFVVFRNNTVSKWVHVQISTVNELFIYRLGVDLTKNPLIKKLKEFLINHIFFAFINLHSEYGGYYNIHIKKDENKNHTNTLFSRYFAKNAPFKIIISTIFTLTKIFLRAYSLPIIFLMKNNTSAYHVGCTMPMKSSQTNKLDTDFLGRIKSWKRVHIVDSSVFPSLPGTTIGLLLIANAYRIVKRIYVK
tara:strand:- start:10 stop:1608 length:1599 start_codon:yes stop_codon:yes gene_type:complete